MARTATKARARPAHAPSIVGWNGIYLEVPVEWDLAAASGDMVQGFLRVDGPGGMHVAVRWQRAKGKQDLHRTVDRYLRGIRKTARKKKVEFESSTDVRLPIQEDNPKRKPLFFNWRGDVQGVGLIWHCPSCGRVTLAQVDGPLKKNLTLVASQVLGTLDDHAVDGIHTWAVYGLAAEIPADFVKSGEKLLSGYIQLQFTRGQSSISLDRWGMADMVLAKQKLEPFVRWQLRKALAPYRTKVENAEIRGHPGIVITGEFKGIRDRIRAAALSVVRMRPGNRVTQYAWHCPETNRVCSVLVQHSAQETGLAEEIAASYVCHI